MHATLSAAVRSRLRLTVHDARTQRSFTLRFDTEAERAAYVAACLRTVKGARYCESANTLTVTEGGE